MSRREKDQCIIQCIIRDKEKVMNMHNQRCIIYNTNEQLIKITQKGKLYYLDAWKWDKGKESDIGGIKANQTQLWIGRKVKIFKPLRGTSHLALKI